MDPLVDDTAAEPPSSTSKFFSGLSQRYQYYLDRWTPHTASRWVFTAVLLIGFAVRILFLQRYQSLLDASTPHLTGRWVVALALNAIFLVRIVLLQGWFIVTYALGIYHLNLLIGFLSPKLDPGLEMAYGETEDGPSLPTRSNEEFRPFVRRLPEFKFWYSVTKATVVAFICTFFDFFNIPVFWPILVMYFIMLFCITMKRQIKHMLHYKYVPFTWGKPKYASVNSDSM